MIERVQFNLKLITKQNFDLSLKVKHPIYVKMLLTKRILLTLLRRKRFTLEI